MASSPASARFGSPAPAFSSMDRLIARCSRALGLAWISNADAALISAAEERNAAKARAALLLGANPAPSNGRNPFWFALHTQPSPAIARLLLDAGASPDHWRDFGFESTLGGSPIHCALSSGQWESAWLLMSRSERPLAPSPTGQSVLASALLSLARPNRQDRAADPQLPAALERLIGMGANPLEPALLPGWDRQSPISPFCENGDPLFLVACFFAGQLGDAAPALTLLDAGALIDELSERSFGACLFFFLGLQQSPQESLSLNESQRQLLSRFAQARLPLSYDASVAGFDPHQGEEAARAIASEILAIERSAIEAFEISQSLPPRPSDPSSPPARGMRL